MNLPRIAATATLVISTLAFAVPAGHAAGASASAPAPAATRGPVGSTFVPGRLLVRFQTGTSAAEQATVVRGVGATDAGSIRDLGVHVVEVPTGAEQRVADALLRTGKVAYAERDSVVRVTAVPNDPMWAQQWGPAKISAPTAWDNTTGSASTVVAVLDSGVTFTHPDMQGRFVPGYDFINNDSDPTDDYGHGTETAGIVGASANNATGIAGMCWSCSIMPMKVVNSAGSSTWSAIASAITWATDHGAKVISMSLAGPSGSTTAQNAINYAVAHDVAVVASAGNSGDTTTMYPGSYPGVLSVAGTQSNDALYSWSTYGSWVDVAAPGCDYTTTRSGGYGSFCGTSAATPVVAGLIGLARSLAPSASVTQVIDAVESSAVNIGSVVAYGRVDAAGTLNALGGNATPQPTPTTSTSTTTSPSPSPSPSPTTTTTTFSGSLNAKTASRSYSVSSGAGQLNLSLTFSKASSLTVTVTSGSQTVLKTSGASPLPASANVAAGSYTLTVSGSTRSSFTLNVTAPTA